LSGERALSGDPREIEMRLAIEMPNGPDDVARQADLTFYAGGRKLEIVELTERDAKELLLAIQGMVNVMRRLFSTEPWEPGGTETLQ